MLRAGDLIESKAAFTRLAQHVARQQVARTSNFAGNKQHVAGNKLFVAAQHVALV